MDGQTDGQTADTASLVDSIRAEAGDGAGQCRDLSSCPHNGSGDSQWTAETKIKTVLYCTCTILYCIVLYSQWPAAGQTEIKTTTNPPLRSSSSAEYFS